MGLILHFPDSGRRKRNKNSVRDELWVGLFGLGCGLINFDMFRLGWVGLNYVYIFRIRGDEIAACDFPHHRVRHHDVLLLLLLLFVIIVASDGVEALRPHCFCK